MNEYEVRLVCQIFGDDETIDALGVAEDVVTVLRNTGHTEAAVSPTSDIDKSLVTLTVRVVAPTPDEAVLDATASIRTAAHARGLFTEGWPMAHQWHAYMKERGVEVVRVSANPVAAAPTTQAPPVPA